MAKEKNAVDKSRNRDLGTITNKTASGFYETNKDGVKVPALHGLKVGDKVKLINGEYVINGGKVEETKSSSDLSDVNARFQKLETELADMKTELADMKTHTPSDKIPNLQATES